MGNLYAATPGQNPGVARIYIYISYSPSTFDRGAPSPRRGSPSLAHVPVIPWESLGVDWRMTWGHNGDVTIDKSMIKV